MSSIPGPKASYCDLVDDCLRAENDDQNFFPLRPSSAGKCTRELAYGTVEYLGLGGPFPKEEKEPNVKRLLRLGHSVEYSYLQSIALLTKYNPKYKIKYKQQVLTLFRLKPVKGEEAPLIEGSLDLAIALPDGTMCFADIKSAKDKFSQGFKTGWDETFDKLANLPSLQRISEQGFYAEDLEAFLAELNDEFFSHNFHQLNTYAHSEFAKEHKVTHCSILRYCKNDSRHFEVRFKPNQKIYDKFKAKLQAAYDAALTGTYKDLKCDHVPGTIGYAFCGCHIMAGENPKEALQAWFATFPKKQWPTDAYKLPSDIQEKLAVWVAFDDQQKEMNDLELEVANELAKKSINKIRLEDDRIYEVKALKTGGAGGGPRTVLRRGKL